MGPVCLLWSEWSPSSCGRVGGGGKAAGNKMPKSRVGFVQGRVPQGTWRGQGPAFLVQTDSLNHSFNQQRFIEHLLCARPWWKQNLCSQEPYTLLGKIDILLYFNLPNWHIFEHGNCEYWFVWGETAMYIAYGYACWLSGKEFNINWELDSLVCVKTL